MSDLKQRVEEMNIFERSAKVTELVRNASYREEVLMHVINRLVESQKETIKNALDEGYDISEVQPYQDDVNYAVATLKSLGIEGEG